MDNGLIKDEKKKSRLSSSDGMLAPGFRFHPTDEELVRYYLRRKICGKSFRFDAISEIDIYKAEPWDLPSMSRLKSRDLEWYFFSVLDKKYGNGARTNRATEKGYWKTTGKDRAVYHKSQIVGMKKTLVYHIGRAPKGQRTNWVMHEYRMVDLELERAGVYQDAFVLCRVFQKSGSGPKNGEQYGAPFVEEEWEDDELEVVPKQEAAEVVDFSDDAFLDGRDLEQILGTDIPGVDASLPLDFYSADDGSHNEEASESFTDNQKLLGGADEYTCENVQHHDQNLYDFPASYDLDTKLVKHEYMGESSNMENFEDLDYLLDEPYLDANDNLQFDAGGFIEANDLSNPVEADTSPFSMLDYLTFDSNPQFLADDPSNIMQNGEVVADQPFIVEQNVNHENEKATESSGQVLGSDNNDNASSSKQGDAAEFPSHGTDFKYPFIKHASHMLGSIPAPPAFAAEFPSKDALRIYSPSAAHVTAGMIQIRQMPDGKDQSLQKHGNYNVVFSFGLSRGDDGSASLESSLSILPGKFSSAVSRGWFYFMFFFLLILSLGFKNGSYICAR